MRARKPSNGQRRTTTSIFILSGLIVGTARGIEQEEPSATPITRVTVDELRARFAYQSLAARLEPLTQKEHAEPTLNEVVRERLTKLENWFSQRGDVRSRSLAVLHSEEAERFISREGFGVSRFRKAPEPSPRYLDCPESPIVAFDESPNKLTDEQSSVSMTLPDHGVREDLGGGWTPSNEVLSIFQLGDQFSFASPESFGHMNDQKQVAGFRAHGFRNRREVWHPDVKSNAKGEIRREIWRSRRIELVSLLKYDEPAVYVSEHLPRMADLVDATMRPLNEFEKKSLARVIRGEDIISEATINEITMLGALRAAKQCVACHGGKRGDLLGAFSYKLYRDPPLQVAEGAAQ